MSIGATRAEKALLEREGSLAAHVRASASQLAALNPASLARSYAVPENRVVDIIKRNGGQVG